MSSYISTETATILAIILGPVVAVAISRYIEYRRERRQRRWSIFCDLMMRRDESLNDTSWSLNLIYAEFYDQKNVLNAWDTLRNYLRDHSGKTRNATISMNKKRRLFSILLQEMAKSLGVKIDSRIIDETGYRPSGKRNEKKENRQIRGLLVDVLKGDKPIVVRNIDNTSSSSDKSDTSDKDAK